MSMCRIPTARRLLRTSGHTRRWCSLYAAMTAGSSFRSTVSTDRVMSTPPLSAAFELEAAFRIIVVQRVARDVLRRLPGLDVRRAPSDHHRQFDFPIELRAAARDHHRVVGTRERRRRLEKDHGLARNLGAGLRRMIPEVEADAHNLARPRERRTEPFGLRDFRRGGAAAPYPVRQRAKAVAAEEALVVLLHQLRRVHPRAVVA